MVDSDAARLPLPQGDPDPAGAEDETQNGSTRRRRAERTVVGQPETAAGRQGDPRLAASRNCLDDGSGEPATDDAPQGSRSHADSHRESNQADTTASQSAMGDADKLFPTLRAIAWL